jgi:hypothetical protein
VEGERAAQASPTGAGLALQREVQRSRRRRSVEARSGFVAALGGGALQRRLRAVHSPKQLPVWRLGGPSGFDRCPQLIAGVHALLRSRFPFGDHQHGRPELAAWERVGSCLEGLEEWATQKPRGHATTSNPRRSAHKPRHLEFFFTGGELVAHDALVGLFADL